MAELRKDPVTERWVIISVERGRRPQAFMLHKNGNGASTNGGFCPFCPGNEELTPPEALAYRPPASAPNSPGWWMRIVPNKFPALLQEGKCKRTGEGMYDKMTGIGAHEVVIESPDHEVSLADLPLRQVEEVLWAYRDRTLHLRKDDRFRYLLIFKNHGRAAGATIDHPHSQIIALPVVPKRVQEEMNGARRYYDYKERCVYCDMIDQELRDRMRLVEENAKFLAFTPFASRSPFETWIIPRDHETHFADIQKTGVTLLAEILKRTLRRLKYVLEAPPYNFMFHTAPFDEGALPHFHWHIEIVPKLTQVAGFEWGTGFYINPMPPESAAQFLREVNVESEAPAESPLRDVMNAEAPPPAAPLTPEAEEDNARTETA